MMLRPFFGRAPSLATFFMILTIFMVLAMSVSLLGSSTPIAAAASLTLATSADAVIALSAGPTHVVLTKSANGEADLGTFDPAGGRRIYLVVEKLSANLPPGTTYDVFLDLPESLKPDRDDPGYSGTLNFFDVPVDPLSGNDHSVAFDVTSVLARLRAAGRATDPLTVTVVPNAPPYAKAKPFLGQLKLVAE